MKTILHTIDTNEPGGAETIFIDLAASLPNEQFRSIVVICGKGWIYDELVKRGIKPILLNTTGSFNWRYLKGLIDIIRQENVDLIQSHLFGSNVYSSIAGLLTRTPVIATFHGAVDIEDDERFVSLKRMAINFGADCIVAVSNSLRDNIVERVSLRKDKTRTIYNGIVTSNFKRPNGTRLREKFGWSSEDVIVGCLGNIHQAKGYDVLLQAAATLKQKAVNYRIVIAGHKTPDLYENLLEQRLKLGVEDTVQFIGFYDEPADFLANIDIFLLPSISEGFSIATIQAMAAKLPVIVTRSGGPEEIVSHEVDGWMIEPGEPDAIVIALEKIISDEVLQNKLAINGQKHAVDHFDIEAMLAGYIAVYEELLS